MILTMIIWFIITAILFIIACVETVVWLIILFVLGLIIDIITLPYRFYKYLNGNNSGRNNKK